MKFNFCAAASYSEGHRSRKFLSHCECVKWTRWYFGSFWKHNFFDGYVGTAYYVFCTESTTNYCTTVTLDVPILSLGASSLNISNRF
jgi:hypothetical protein